MIQIMGYVGAVCLALCAIPQLVKVLITKNVSSLSVVNLVLWSIGCTLMSIYVFLTSKDIPLLANYILNAIISYMLIANFIKYK